MHRSRLAAIGIDCPSDTALAYRPLLVGRPRPDASPPEAFAPDDPYLAVGAVAGREVFVQQIDDAARVHLDIETDDVEAEVARLEASAQPGSGRCESWWIMQDPSGQPFCVVQPQTRRLPRRRRHLALMPGSAAVR